MDDPPSILGTPREWAKDLAMATVIGLFLGVIGPFGSFNGGNVELRVAYWVINIWIGFIVLATTVRLCLRAAVRFDLPVWFTIAVGVAAGSVPLGLVIAWFSAWFWPGNHGHVSAPLVWYAQTLAISEPLAFGYYFLGRRNGHHLEPARPPAPTAPAAASASVSPTTAATFLDRLPPRLGRDLLCLQMEDHYVRAHTALGSDLMLLPLKDAIGEVASIDGAQVHRSWWVAREAVDSVIEDGRNIRLRLRGGLEAPVSRSAVAPLRAAGWLKTPPPAS